MGLRTSEGQRRSVVFSVEGRHFKVSPCSSIKTSKPAGPRLLLSLKSILVPGPRPRASIHCPRGTLLDVSSVLVGNLRQSRVEIGDRHGGILPGFKRCAHR